MHPYPDAPPGDGGTSSDAGKDRLPDHVLMLATLSALEDRLAVPFPERAELDHLRAAFPDFSFGVSRGWRGPVFEAWRDGGASGLYAVITQDARELWRELSRVPAPGGS
jgi:hypothetical protein